jgi:hypothetical protein
MWPIESSPSPRPRPGSNKPVVVSALGRERLGDAVGGGDGDGDRDTDIESTGPWENWKPVGEEGAELGRRR